MPEFAVIGGTGLTSLEGLEIVHREVMLTPYGEPSGPIVHGVLAGRKIAFLARHGSGHTIPPHNVNYRANIHALKEIGVRRVIAVAAVGGIAADLPPGRIAIPDQIIDYTSARACTFFEGDPDAVTHIDFTWPYSESLRELLIGVCRSLGIDAREGGTYGATQGPRLETAAEIDRMERDGCTLVGMTGMPEAALARELDLEYATCAVVANWAAGRGGAGTITMKEIERALRGGMEQVRAILAALARAI